MFLIDSGMARWSRWGDWSSDGYACSNGGSTIYNLSLYLYCSNCGSAIFFCIHSDYSWESQSPRTSKIDCNRIFRLSIVNLYLRFPIDKEIIFAHRERSKSNLHKEETMHSWANFWKVSCHLHSYIYKINLLKRVGRNSQFTCSISFLGARPERMGKPKVGMKNPIKYQNRHVTIMNNRNLMTILNLTKNLNRTWSQRSNLGRSNHLNPTQRVLTNLKPRNRNKQRTLISLQDNIGWIFFRIVPLTIRSS